MPQEGSGAIPGAISASTLSLTSNAATATQNSSSSNPVPKARGRPKKSLDPNGAGPSSQAGVTTDTDANTPKRRRVRQTKYTLGKMEVGGELLPIYGPTLDPDADTKKKKHSITMVDVNGEMLPVFGPLTESDSRLKKATRILGQMEFEGGYLPVFGPLNNPSTTPKLQERKRKHHLGLLEVEGEKLPIYGPRNDPNITKVPVNRAKNNIGLLEVNGEMLPIYGPRNHPAVRRARGRPRAEPDVHVGANGEITTIEPKRKKQRLEGVDASRRATEIVDAILGKAVMRLNAAAQGASSTAQALTVEALRRIAIRRGLLSSATTGQLLDLESRSKTTLEVEPLVRGLLAELAKGSKGEPVKVNKIAGPAPRAPIRRPVPRPSSLPIIRALKQSPSNRIHLSGGNVSTARLRRADATMATLVKSKPNRKGKAKSSQNVPTNATTHATSSQAYADALPGGSGPRQDNPMDIDILDMDFNVREEEPFDVTQEIDLDFPATPGEVMVEGIAAPARPRMFKARAKGVKATSKRPRRMPYVEMPRVKPGLRAAPAMTRKLPTRRGVSGPFSVPNPLFTTRASQRTNGTSSQTTASRTRNPQAASQTRASSRVVIPRASAATTTSRQPVLSLRESRRSPSITFTGRRNAVSSSSQRAAAPKPQSKKAPAASTPSRSRIPLVPTTPNTASQRKSRLLPYVEIPTSSKRHRPPPKQPINRATVVLPITRPRRRNLITKGCYIPFRDDDSDTEINPRKRKAHIPLRPLKPLPRGSAARSAKPSEPEPIPRRFVMRPGPGMVEPFKSILDEETFGERLEELECGWKGCEAVMASEVLLRKHMEVRGHWKQGVFNAGVSDQLELSIGTDCPRYMAGKCTGGVIGWHVKGRALRRKRI
jgi:hypothetical protein